MEKKCAICGFNRVTELCHIIPKHLGGKNTPDNLIRLCPNHHTLLDRGLLNIEELAYIEDKITAQMRNNKNPVQFDYLCYVLKLKEKSNLVKLKQHK
jgi:predicted restriction endonuclease